MSKLSEEEILDKLRKMLYYIQKANECGLSNNDFKEHIEALEGILDLYNKEKETSHYIQSQLDIANAKLIEEKEKNKELEEHHQQFYAGEMYTAKQVKNLEQTRKMYYIHKDKVREFALSESQADTYHFKTVSLDRLLKFLEEE